MVYQLYGLCLPYRQIAKNLNVDVATVSRVIKIFEDTGAVSKKSQPQGYDHHLKQLTTTKCAEYYIVELVVGKPGIYLRELQDEVHRVLIFQLPPFVTFYIKIDSHTVH